jgi:hypothetical protein
MMNMAAMMNMAMGNADEEEEKVARPPPDPIDPRVKEICRHFGIDDKICEKLNKAGMVSSEPIETMIYDI